MDTDHGLALLLGVLLPGASFLASRRGQPEPLDSGEKFQVYVGNALSQALLASLVAGAWWLRGRPPSDLGIAAPRMETLAWVVVGLLVVAAALDTWLQMRGPGAIARTRHRWMTQTPFMPATGGELAGYSVMAVAAAVSEELVFRGFLVRYLESLLAGFQYSTVLAIALPAIVFGLAHWYQGALRATKIIVFSCGFGALFVLTSSLLLPVLVHALVNLAMGLVSLRIMRPGG